MPSVMEMVTDRVIRALEQGTVPWQRPWLLPDRGAFNRISGKKYSLINQLILEHEGEYASWKQWTQLGGTINPDERPEIVVFWKWPDEPEDDNKEKSDGIEEQQAKKKRRRPILRYHRVYHISQVKGVEPVKSEAEVRYDHQPIEYAGKIFTDYITRQGITLDEGEYREAYYSPRQDMIHIPSIGLYEYPEQYYSTLYHEAVHSTGESSRLCREGLKKVSFGSETYSQEELIAEMGAAALMTEVGIETANSFNNSAAYIDGWLSVLKGDKRMIVFAANQAEKAINFILGN